MTSFTHLHVHSGFSILDGLATPKEIVARTKELGMDAVAITDMSNMYAAIKFYKEAKAQGIKPILGSEVFVVPEYRLNEDNKLDVSEGYKAVILAQNASGYRDVMEIISEGYSHGLTKLGNHDIPFVEEAYIAERSSDIIMLSAGIEGAVGKAILEGDIDKAEKKMKFFQSVFGDRYFTEVSRTGRKEDDKYLNLAVNLSVDNDIPLVATNNVKFLYQDDFQDHEIRVCVQESQTRELRGFNTPYSPHMYLKSPEEMERLFPDIPEALENTQAIIDSCDVELTLDQPALPKFPTPNGEDEATYLRTMSYQGLEKRFDAILSNVPENEVEEVKATYKQRLETELEVINGMGFPGYFLIVADFIQWSKRNDIPVGPGRGSGAGSLVAYCCDITNLDPLPYDLLFERFLNPERVSMPDFDIDFCVEGRDRVIEYVAKRYGQNAVSQIATFGTMAAKSSIKDTARVEGKPYAFGDKISKMIPNDPGITIDTALKQSDNLLNAYEQDSEVKRIIDIARNLEGLPRSIGRHAGGVLISPTKLTDFTPIHADGETVASQYDKNDVETAGLVKFDFLGLRNLTVIDNAVKLVNRRRESEGLEPLNIDNIKLDDKPSFDLLKEADTTAIFQLESNGMKGLIKKLQPDDFEDIVALVALYRPGPLQSGMVEDFIDRKHGRKEVEYPDPCLEEVLKPTYGVIVYQEQVMQIAQVMAGYSLGEADILRRAMGKKKPEEMAKQKTRFMEGAEEQGHTKEKAAEVFELMEFFAGYGFNKSHSAAYALVTYQTAFLKAHYPVEFMSAVMSSDMGKTEKLVKYFADIKKKDVKVVPPNVNTSSYSFLPTRKGNILYGLMAIKGVGASACQEIIQERDKNGPYKDMFDFASRLSGKVTKTSFEGLVKSGAFDIFKKDRGVLMANIPVAIKYRKTIAEKKKKAQAKAPEGPTSDLFASNDAEAIEVDKPDYIPAQHISYRDKLLGESASIGVYLSGHPMDEFYNEVETAVTARNKDIDLEQHGFKSSEPKYFLQVGVVVERTVKRKNMFFALDDTTDALSCVMFKNVAQKYGNRIENGAVVCVSGKIEEDKYNGDGEVKMTVNKVLSIQELREKFAKQVVVKASPEILGNKELIDETRSLAEQNSPGYSKLFFLTEDEEGNEVIYQNHMPSSIVPNENIVNTLRGNGFEVDVVYEGKERRFDQEIKTKRSEEPVAEYSREELVGKVRGGMQRISALLSEAHQEKGEQVKKNALKRKRRVSQSPSPSN